MDFLSLKPRLEGRDLGFSALRITRPDRIYLSKYESEIVGFCLEFIFDDCEPARYFVHLYKKDNPAYQAPDRSGGGNQEKDSGESVSWTGIRFDWPVYNPSLDPPDQEGFEMVLYLDGKRVRSFGCDEFMYLPCQYAHAEEPVSYDPATAMKIAEVTEEHILFTNGKKITFYHSAQCCEWNFADFEQIDDVGRNAVYYENELVFEPLEGMGFRLGNRGGIMTFIPCYSSQEGVLQHGTEHSL